MPATHSKQAGTEACLSLGNVIFYPETREHISTAFQSISDDFGLRELRGIYMQNQ